MWNFILWDDEEILSKESFFRKAKNINNLIRIKESIEEEFFLSEKQKNDIDYYNEEGYYKMSTDKKKGFEFYSNMLELAFIALISNRKFNSYTSVHYPLFVNCLENQHILDILLEV